MALPQGQLIQIEIQSQTMKVSFYMFFPFTHQGNTQTAWPLPVYECVCLRKWSDFLTYFFFFSRSLFLCLFYFFFLQETRSSVILYMFLESRSRCFLKHSNKFEIKMKGRFGCFSTLRRWGVEFGASIRFSLKT